MCCSTMEKYDGHSVWVDNGYPKIWLNGKNVRLHKYVWEKHNGPVPPGMVVHHKDGNKLNYDLSNLELMDSTEHHRMHGKENKGRKLSAETRRRMSESRKGRVVSPEACEKTAKALRKRVVCLETGEVFKSIKCAAERYGTGSSHIIQVCKGVRNKAGGHTWKYESEVV